MKCFLIDKTKLFVYITLVFKTILPEQAGYLFSPYPLRLDERLITQQEIKACLEESKKTEIPLKSSEVAQSQKKEWTFIVYIAADNNLHVFAWKNLKQMEKIGSNERINIVVQINTPGKNPTKRYLVQKDRRILIDNDTHLNTKLNSGSAQTLIDCVDWAVNNFPAENYALFFWNHGSAAIDPNFSKTINPCDLFYKDPIDNLLNVDRSVNYLTLLAQINANMLQISHQRGICFDDTFKSYITNHDLNFALHEISTKILNGQPWGIIAFDACLMSMIEISSIVRKYARFMTASQEVVYGTGQNYELLLKPFETGSLSAEEFAKHIVVAYQNAYQKIINDYTFSALDLEKSIQVENNINQISQLLEYGIKNQKNYALSNIIRKCKSVQYCTCFDEPSFVDIGHFFSNLLNHINVMYLNNPNETIIFQKNLSDLINQGLIYLNQLVIENRVGPKQRNAKGLSIYFPELSIAANYLQSPFALENSWGSMLTTYLSN